MWLPPVSSQCIISNKLTMLKIYKSQAFLSTSSQSRISLVEEKNSLSSTASSGATKREKVLACCPPRTVLLWQRTWAITQLPPASWPGPSFAPLLSGVLCPVPTWGGVRLSSTWTLRWGWISFAFVRMRTRISLSMRMMMMIDPSQTRQKQVKHLRWRAQQSLPQGQATIGVFFSNECHSGSCEP